MSTKLQSFPYHVAIIMDGNGRWAQKRGRPRIWGHLRGASVVSSIVERSVNLDVKSLTLYAFSTENQSRPKEEVHFLFKLLDKFLIKERRKILENNIKFNVIGDYKFLHDKTLKKISKLREETSLNDGLTLNFAFGYGGRQEILRGVNNYMSKYPNKEITEAGLKNELFDSSINDIDLLIRTGGEKRLSNFLLWQLSYAELYFTDTHWPEFSTKEYQSILSEVSLRTRRFGKVEGQNFSKNSKFESKAIN